MRDFILYGIALFLFSSCNKNRDEDAPSAATNIYVLGNNDGAVLFKNGVSRPMPSSTFIYPPKFNAIDVANNGDIHICGYENNRDAVSGAEYEWASYWKNETKQLFFSPQPSSASIITDIKVIGNDVYMAGIDANKAVVWKNGMAVNLTNGIRGASAKSIFVNETDVYAGGFEVNLAGYQVAKIWKNGLTHSVLSNGAYNASVTSIFINGTDVYACGYETDGIDRAVVWKNGVKNYLGAMGIICKANQILVENNNVHVVGYETLPSTLSKAKYWKNGVSVAIDLGYQSVFNSIAIKNGDVYIAGAENNNSTSRSVAKYWKNGVATILSNGTFNARADKIIVK